MSASDWKQLMGPLMLFPLITVISIGFGFHFFRLRRRRHRAALRDDDDSFLHPGTLSVRRTFRNPFEQPTRWLAVRTQDLGAVQQSLGLVRPTPCSWEEGIIESREHKLFISSAIAGWTLVVGAGLPDPSEDVDACYHFLVSLSQKLGHIQYFSFNRVLNHHAWALLERGCIFRAYVWAGHTLWNQGPVTAAEKDVGMVCFDYAADPADYALQENWTLNSEKVSKLAGWWSIDPANIGDRAWHSRHGIVGEPSPTRHP